jgi:hypothetical protein
MAGALGMTLTQFNNNLYEKNGCRFFEVSELEAMEDISNTSLLADYFARRRGALLVDAASWKNSIAWIQSGNAAAAEDRLIRLSNRHLKMG